MLNIEKIGAVSSLKVRSMCSREVRVRPAKRAVIGDPRRTVHTMLLQ
jgi:hypothetical protein